MCSRDTSFVQGISEITHDKGVDVALNSLARELLRATWKFVASFGRFMELGKRDIITNTHLEMSQFEHSVKFTAIDLSDVIQLRPKIHKQTLAEVMDLITNQQVKPVSPLHEFPTSKLESAFRSLQNGKLIGKVVIVPQAHDMVMVSLFLFLLVGEAHILTKATLPIEQPAFLRDDVSYLITGELVG